MIRHSLIVIARRLLLTSFIPVMRLILPGYFGFNSLLIFSGILAISDAKPRVLGLERTPLGIEKRKTPCFLR